MKNCIFFLLIFLPGFVSGQFTPEKLGESVNSDYDEINPVLSPSGDTLYFTRIGHPENNFGTGDSQDVWFSIKNDQGHWSEAKRLSEVVNVGRYNALFSISPDGQKALISGVYNRKGDQLKRRGLSIVQRTKEGWANPQQLKVKQLQKMMDGRYFSAAMNWEHDVVVMSFSGAFNAKASRLFLSARKGKSYKKPFRIKGLNGRGNEFAPFITDDGSTLYYASNHGKTGNFEIVKTVRQQEGWREWSEPLVLSDTVNSKADELYYKEVSGGNAAFFVSNADGNSDIYHIKLFEEEPFIVVSGQVKYDGSEIPVAGREIQIIIGGQPADSVVIDQQTAKYQLVLPLGADYEVKAVVPNADTKPVLVAASMLKEKTEMPMDLYVAPWEYAKVTGRLIDKATGTALPTDVVPTVFINGSPSDKIEIAPGTGLFETTFALGSTYTLKAEAPGYRSIETRVDLTAADEFVELEQNIVVEKIKEAIISGKIINKKTFEPLDSAIVVSILINDKPGIATIDPKAQTYSLKVPLGHSYTLLAKAENFYPQSEMIDLTGEDNSVKVYRDLYLSPLEVGDAVALENIFFETAKAVLKSSSFAELDKVINLMEENEGIKIEIGGHTDSEGSDLTNQKLSNRRAKAVRDYIVENGISPFRISYFGYGEANPIADNSTEEGRQQNRRVEFVVVDNQ